MKEATRYRYEKRIKELERDNERLRKFESLGRQIFDWLAPFAGDEDKRGKASLPLYGLKLFRQMGLL